MQHHEITWKELMVAAIAAAAACVVFYTPIWTAGMSLLNAVVHDYTAPGGTNPPWILVKEEFLRGFFPLWVDASDAPPNLQAFTGAYFYPLLLWTIPFDFTKVANVHFVSRIWLMILGGYLFARSGLGMGRAGAVMAATAFAFTGIVQKRLTTTEINVLWLLPVFLLTVGKLATSSRFKWVLLCAATAALALYSGHPIATFYMFITGGLWFVYLYFLKGVGVSCFIRAGCAGLLALFFSAPQLIPGVEMLALGWNYHFSGPLEGSYAVRCIFSVLLPWLTGTAKFNLATLFYAPYLGLVPVLMTVFGFFRIRKLGQYIPFFCAYFLVFLGLSFALPVFSVLGYLPPLDRIINSVAAYYSVALACGLIAGGVLELALKYPSEALKLCRWLAGSILAVLVAGVWAFILIKSYIGSPETRIFFHRPGEAFSSLPRELAFGTALAGASAVAAYLPAKRKKYGAALMIFIAFFGLWAHSLGWNPENRGLLDRLEASTAADYLKSHYNPDKTTISQCDLISPNLYMLTGVKNFMVYWTIHFKRYADLMLRLNGMNRAELATGEGREKLKRLTVARGRFYLQFPISYFGTPFSDALGIEYAFVCSEPLPANLKPVHASDAAVYRSETALPEAFLSGRWSIADDEQAAFVSLVNLERSEIRKIIFIKTDPGVENSTLPPVFEGPAGQVDLVDKHWQKIQLKVGANSNSVLLLRRIYYPGWEARVDGARTRIIRADYLWQAIVVPAGKHEVEFRYVPAGFGLALWGFITSVMCATGVLILSRRKNKNHR